MLTEVDSNEEEGWVNVTSDFWDRVEEDRTMLFKPLIGDRYYRCVKKIISETDVDMGYEDRYCYRIVYKIIFSQ